MSFLGLAYVMADDTLSSGHHHCKHTSITFIAYMQKTCDVAEKAILAKKIAEKVRKSRQNVNRDKSA